jgi:hypothetical protein
MRSSIRLTWIALLAVVAPALPGCSREAAEPASAAVDADPRVTVQVRDPSSPRTVPAPTGDAAFDAAHAQAVINERSSGYDEALSRAMAAEPRFPERLDACIKAHPGEQRVYGYFDFPEQGAYRLVLRPGNAFATCVAAAAEGYALPEPPERPYVHGFSFTVEARPAGAQ